MLVSFITLTNTIGVMDVVEEHWLTIREAAIMLNVSENTLRNWDASGKFKAERHPLNNYRLYRESDVRKLGRILTGGNDEYYEENKMETVLRKLSFSQTVKQLNRLYRDHDMDLMTRFEEISKILFCKFLDDQKVKNNSRSQFAIRNGESAQDVYNKISRFYLESLPDGVDSRGGIATNHTAILNAVRLLKTIDLSEYDEDIKGTTYEEMIKNTFEANENQQYFTPRRLVDFMVELANPQPTENLCDPACGTGGFLIATLKKIRREMRFEEKSNIDSELYNYSQEKMLGIEVDSRIAWIAQLNCYLHGGSATSIHHLSDGGSLSLDNGSLEILPDSSQDIIITNPPFGSDFTDVKNLERYRCGQEKKSVRRGVLFVERCLRALKAGGRLVIIVDDSILNSQNNEMIRRVITKESNVLAVISLPDEMFMPYATVKSSVLLLRKKHPNDTNQVQTFMAELKDIGKRNMRSTTYLSSMMDEGPSDFAHVLDMWQKHQLGKRIESHDESICFVSRLDLGKSNPTCRLDTTFHHPAKMAALGTLSSAKYSIRALSELFTLRNETVIPAVSYPDEEIPYLGLADIEKETGCYQIRFLRGSQIKSAVKKFYPGDILFAKLRPQLRKVVFVREEGYCSSECLVLCLKGRNNRPIQQTLIELPNGTSPDQPGIDVCPEFISIVLRSNLVQGQIRHQVTGIGRPRISTKVVMRIKIPIPPLKEQEKLVKQFQTEAETAYALHKQGELMLVQSKRTLKLAHENIIESLHKRKPNSL